MPKLSDLKVVIGLSKSGLRKLNSDLRTTRAKFRSNFGEITNLAKRAAVTIGTTMAGAVTAMLKASADLERVQVSFRSIMGGADGAARMVEKLNKFAANTPFQLEDISMAARQLLAVGVKENQLEESLRVLGDIAAASGSSITEMSAIYAKAQAKGKIDQEILNQLLDRGINIKSELLKVTGQVGDEFEATSVSVEDFNQALRNMATEGGFAEGSMQNLSTTVYGLLSTLGDVSQQFLAQKAASSGLSDVFKTKLLLSIAAINDHMTVTDAQVQQLSDSFNDLRERAMRPTQANADQLTDEFIALQAGLETAIKHADRGSAAYKRLTGMLEGTKDASVELNQAVLAGLPAGAPKPTAQPKATGPVRPADMAASMTIAASTMQQAISEKVLQPLLDVGFVMEDIAINKVNQLGEAQLALANTIGSTFQSMFSELLQGTRSFGQIMGDILESLMMKLASMVAAYGVITLLTGGAAGAISLGGFLKQGFGLGAIPQMASGGLFTGSSLAMVGEGPSTSMINPEVVAPLDKLRNMLGGNAVTVTGRLDGRDILISSERAGFDRSRVRGF